MKTLIRLEIAVAALCTIALGSKSEAASHTDPGWPRQMNAGNSVITVYQPQFDAWKDYKELQLRAAVGVRNKSETKDRLAVLEGTAQTVVDTSARSVKMDQFRYTLRFPDTDPAEVSRLERDVRIAMPGTRTLTVALDRVLAYLDAKHTTAQKDVAVNMDPPQILYSSVPAVLVMFMGEPKYSPVREGDNSLLYAVNTNWDLFHSTADNRFYLRNDDSWLTEAESGNEWMPVSKFPPLLMNLPADENWGETRKHIPGTASSVVPVVFETTQPAELIITEGAPQTRQIPGTKIMQITNTQSLLFFNATDENYYFLVAGRWFRAKQLAGPWSAATTNLPEDFQQIPPTDDIAEVLSSVKGTDEAQDAVLLASVPTMATVTADEATLDVAYEGNPNFQPISGTTVQYAVNTPQEVFLVNGSYYCCSEGVWFCSSSPTGPWGLCKQVDPAIYPIPPTDPHHNVTYVAVYDSGSDYVTYGYTAGYVGGYVSNGLLVFGAGMLASAILANGDYYYHYPAPLPYYSYGCAAHYNYGAGGYYGAASYYGPYGGAGRAAAYNPATGIYSRGAAAYGPYGSAGVRQAYNPWTDTYAARAKVNTPAGSATRFYAQNDNGAAWGGSRSGSKGSVGWAQTSKGGKAAGWDTRFNEGFAAKNSQGDVVVGNDGNVYRREDGSWQKYENGGWNNVETPGGNRLAANQASQSAVTRGEQNLASASTREQLQGAAAQRNDLGAGRVSSLPAATDRPAASRLQGNLMGNTDVAGAAGNMRAGASASTMERSTGQTAQLGQSINQNVYSDLQRQDSARARGNANTSQYQRRATSSQASRQTRTATATRSSAATRSGSSSFGSGASAPAAARGAVGGGGARGGGGRGR